MKRQGRAFLVPAGLFLGLLAWLNATTPGFTLADTYALLDGTKVAADCVDAGDYSSCGPQVAQYALLQYLPSFAFYYTGFSYGTALNGLVALSGLASLGTLALVWVGVRRFVGSPAAAVAVAIVLSGPLVWYAHSGFGEPLATLAITGFVVALLLRAPPVLVGVAILFGGISKETAVPFMVALAVICWVIRGQEAPVRRSEVIAIAIGGALALALDVGFNVFRYGTVTNGVYSQAQYRVGAADGANNFVALLLAPTGGLFWMWPGFLAVFVAAVVAGVRAAPRRALRALLEPGVGLGLLLLGLLVLLAAWHAPFGGTAWGPRLILPWLPALMVVGMAAYADRFRTAVTALSARAGALALVFVLLAVAGVPQIVATVDSSRYPRQAPGTDADFRELVIRPYAPDVACPTLPAIEEDRGYYFSCLKRTLWNKGLVPADAFGELDRGKNLLFAAAWLAALAGLLGYARVRAQPPARA